MPFAKGFGWTRGELNLDGVIHGCVCVEKLFGFGFGKGYPLTAWRPIRSNKKNLPGRRARCGLRQALIEILRALTRMR